MTWTKLSDDFGDDLWTISDAAFRLHTEGLLWSNRKLLDLRIPKDDLGRFAKRPEALAELIDTGLWSDKGDHFLIVHHARYQRTRNAVVNQQRKNKANRAQRGQSTPPTRELLPRQPRPRRSNDSLHDSSNDSLHDSLHEMDRPGQALAFNSEHLQNEEEVAADQQTGEVLEAEFWPVTDPGSGGFAQTVTKASGTEPLVEPRAPGVTRAEPAAPTCTILGCGNRLHSTESMTTGVCRRGDDEHKRARAA